MRQVGLYLLQAYTHLREVDPSKKLLLLAVMRDENLANNGEVFTSIWFFTAHISLRSRRNVVYLLEDRIIER